MKQRLTFSLAIALAAASGLAAADPATAPLVSPLQADCVWAATPDSFRQSLSGSVDEQHFKTLLDGWAPNDAQLAAIASGCHLAGAADQPSAELATKAIMGRALRTWAEARLTGVYKLTPAQLDGAWRSLPLASRVDLGHSIGGGPAAQLLETQVLRVIGAMNITNLAEIVTVRMYLTGRAMVAVLEAVAD